MGYQESFVYFGGNTEDNNSFIEKTIELFKRLDVRTIDDEIGSCVERITFKQDRNPWPLFNKGMQALWIVGERQCQRSPFRLFDIYEDELDNPNLKLLTKEEKDMISQINIIFLDYFDSDKIREVLSENSPYVERESLSLLPEMPKRLQTIKVFAGRLEQKLRIDTNYSGSIFALNDYESLDQTIHEICKDMNLSLNKKEEHIEHLGVPRYSYSFRDLQFAHYHDTPHMEKDGTWYLSLGTQRLRALARAIDDNGPLGQKEAL